MEDEEKSRVSVSSQKISVEACINCVAYIYELLLPSMARK
jgi:hypothetical protein